MLEPRNPTILLNRARIKTALHKYDEAENIYRGLLESGFHGKAFNQPYILASLLTIATETKHLQQLNDYLVALKGKDIPGRPEFLLSSAKLLMKTRAFDKSELMLQQFQKDYPNHPLEQDSYILLGQLYNGTMQTSQALTTYLTVLERFPGSSAALSAGSRIAEMYVQSGQHAGAIAIWKEMAKAYPGNDQGVAGIYQAALVAYRHMGDHRQATALFKQFLEAGSQDTRLVRQAQDNIARINAGKPPLELESR
jgi:TolA-binding protein